MIMPSNCHYREKGRSQIMGKCEFPINAIRNLPDDITYDEIMERIFVQKKVARGMARITNGESVPNEIVKKK